MPTGIHYYINNLSVLIYNMYIHKAYVVMNTDRKQ